MSINQFVRDKAHLKWTHIIAWVAISWVLLWLQWMAISLVEPVSETNSLCKFSNWIPSTGNIKPEFSCAGGQTYQPQVSDEILLSLVKNPDQSVVCTNRTRVWTRSSSLLCTQIK